MQKNRFLAGLGLATVLVSLSLSAAACTRVVYHGVDGLNITGRTMDW